MFGPQHPRKTGRDGLTDTAAGFDQDLPGFGPFGTAGQHCFDPQHPTYRRIAAMNALRASFPALRQGRQYQRPIAFLGYPFGLYGGGEIIAWSRILDDEEVLCVLNPHGNQARGADVLVDATLTPTGSFTVVLNSAAANPQSFTGTNATGSTVNIKRHPNGSAYVEIRQLGPSEILVLSNQPKAREGGIRS